MGMTWTDDQRKVIELRDRNILVSAAAGSGKTAVLVERIIKIITDKEHPVDIDRLLIVTFTNAAAAEMRERIGKCTGECLKRTAGRRTFTASAFSFTQCPDHDDRQFLSVCDP